MQAIAKYSKYAIYNVHLQTQKKEKHCFSIIEGVIFFELFLRLYS